MFWFGFHPQFITTHSVKQQKFYENSKKIRAYKRLLKREQLQQQQTQSQSQSRPSFIDYDDTDAAAADDDHGDVDSQPQGNQQQHSKPTPSSPSSSSASVTNTIQLPSTRRFTAIDHRPIKRAKFPPNQEDGDVDSGSDDHKANHTWREEEDNDDNDNDDDEAVSVHQSEASTAKPHSKPSHRLQRSPSQYQKQQPKHSSNEVAQVGSAAVFHNQDGSKNQNHNGIRGNNKLHGGHSRRVTLKEWGFEVSCKTTQNIHWIASCDLWLWLWLVWSSAMSLVYMVVIIIHSAIAHQQEKEAERQRREEERKKKEV